MTHGIESLGLGVAQPQADRNSLCVLGDGNRERAEAADGFRLQSHKALGGDHRRKRTDIGDTAENRQQQPAIHHRRDRAGGALRDHQLEDFHAHSFCRKARKACACGNASEISGAIGFTCAIGGVDAEEPEDAQIVFGDPLVRIADEAHAFCGDILKPTDVVVHDAFGVNRQAVDGEVAPLRISYPVAAERYLRLAAKRLGILAQRGDLKRLRIDNQRHGAVFDARRHALDAGRLGAADHLRRQGGGRDIDIAGRNLQERIADRAADHARFLAVAVQQLEHASGWTGFEPGRVVEHARITHFSTPGTNLPFSICAGM